jgi:hypothetical protein
MRSARTRLQLIVALAGVLALLAAVALAAASARPTEATWNDTVAGEARFGMQNPYQDSRFARAISTFGFMDRATRDNNVGPVTAVRETPATSRQIVGPSTHDSATFLTGILPLHTVGFSCSTLDVAQAACANGNTAGVALPTANAVSETRSLDVRTARLLGSDLVTYQGRNPIRATATCSPTQGLATLTSDGPVILGRSGLFEEEVRVPIPGPNSEQSGVRSWGSYDYVATLQHVKKESRGHALSELRLRVHATGTGGAERWNLTLILAHAECGVDRETTAAPTRPTTGEWPTIAAQTSRTMAVQADTHTAAPTTTQPQAVDPESDEPAGEESADSTTATTPTSTTSAATTPTTSTTPATATATAESTTPAVQPEPTEQSDVADEPQGPENVDVGRWFALVGRDGTELGSAKVEDVVRTPGCGVELTLHIATSAEAGAERWSSLGPDDFAEVRPGGATRDAGTVSSDCEQSANSTTTRLSPDLEYEIVVAFQLDDSAQRAMLRPDGTAGWIVDLPPLTQVTTSTAATTTVTADSDA